MRYQQVVNDEQTAGSRAQDWYDVEVPGAAGERDRDTVDGPSAVGAGGAEEALVALGEAPRPPTPDQISKAILP